MREPLPKLLLMLAWKAVNMLVRHLENDRSIAYPMLEILCSNVVPKQPNDNVSFVHQQQRKEHVVDEGMCETLLREPPPIC
jgi:hypothetical protein